MISREYGEFNGFSEFTKTRNEKILCKRTPSYKEKLYVFHYQVDSAYVTPGDDEKVKSEPEEDPVLVEVKTETIFKKP